MSHRTHQGRGKICSKFDWNQTKTVLALPRVAELARPAEASLRLHSTYILSDERAIVVSEGFKLLEAPGSTWGIRSHRHPYSPVTSRCAYVAASCYQRSNFPLLKSVAGPALPRSPQNGMSQLVSPALHLRAESTLKEATRLITASTLHIASLLSRSGINCAGSRQLLRQE